MPDQNQTPDARERELREKVRAAMDDQPADVVIRLVREHDAGASPSLPDSGERDDEVLIDRLGAQLYGPSRGAPMSPALRIEVRRLIRTVREHERALVHARRGEPPPGQFVSIAANKAMAASASSSSDGGERDAHRARVEQAARAVASFYGADAHEVTLGGMLVDGDAADALRGLHESLLGLDASASSSPSAGGEGDDARERDKLIGWLRSVFEDLANGRIANVDVVARAQVECIDRVLAGGTVDNDAPVSVSPDDSATIGGGSAGTIPVTDSSVPSSRSGRRSPDGEGLERRLDDAMDEIAELRNENDACCGCWLGLLATAAYGLKETSSPEAASGVVVAGAVLAGAASLRRQRRQAEKPAPMELVAGSKRDGDEEA